MRTALAISAPVLAALVLAAGAPAAAQSQQLDSAGGWGDYTHPGRTEHRRIHVREGLGRLVTALRQQRVAYDRSSYVTFDEALTRFADARAYFEDDPDLAFYTAVALSRWQRPSEDGGTEMRTDEALAEWQRLRELDPDYVPSIVASQMASLYARRGDVEHAAAEYERALQLWQPAGAWLLNVNFPALDEEVELAELYAPRSRPLLHGNLAEHRMLLGQLDRAIASYQRAIGESRRPHTRALGHWGLALARIRAGDRDAALDAARRAIEADPIAADPRFSVLQHDYGAFAALHHPDVFFEPRYEIHAYHAVGYEAYADMPDRRGSRRRSLALALASWRRFLAEGGTSSRYSGHAREAVTRLEAAVADLPEDDEEPPATPAWRPEDDVYTPLGIAATPRRPWLPLNLP